MRGRARCFSEARAGLTPRLSPPLTVSDFGEDGKKYPARILRSPERGQQDTPGPSVVVRETGRGSLQEAEALAAERGDPEVEHE